jgi:hypothetical protein
MTENTFFPLSFAVQYHRRFTAHYTHRQVTLYKKLTGMVGGILSMLAGVALDLDLPNPVDAS